MAQGLGRCRLLANHLRQAGWSLKSALAHLRSMHQKSASRTRLPQIAEASSDSAAAVGTGVREMICAGLLARGDEVAGKTG